MFLINLGEFFWVAGYRGEEQLRRDWEKRRIGMHGMKFPKNKERIMFKNKI